jgi:class 3 adenylate cyclase
MMFLYFSHIADRLKAGAAIDPQALDCVTMMLSDIAMFDKLIERSNPIQVVTLLNEIYTQMDDVIDTYDAFKVTSNKHFHSTYILQVHTVNDTYMLVCGISNKDEGKNSNTNGLCFTISVKLCSVNGNNKTNKLTHHVAIAAEMSLHLQMNIGRYYIPHLPDEKVQLCIGLHTGMDLVLGMC